MNKEEFKRRWESDDYGGGITFDDIANCAIEWGICTSPRTTSPTLVRYEVLAAAQVIDAEEYR
jgi:uncharacterized Fe-S cluster-containing radical SAM superfamily protein